MKYCNSLTSYSRFKTREVMVGGIGFGGDNPIRVQSMTTAELRPFNIRVCQVNPSEVTTAFGNTERVEREEIHNKLSVREISHAIVSAIQMDERGFINELNVWATNPFN